MTLASLPAPAVDVLEAVAFLREDTVSNTLRSLLLEALSDEADRPEVRALLQARARQRRHLKAVR